MPAALSGRLQQMARFRNLLVHVYWTIDFNRVFDVLEHDVQDLREFSGLVAALL
ncbi:MAG TPA: HepT-like ribonuclease domain-containing protein [Vicinamibacterales bacterium]|nr:HepT-like ribonuclease domain-containing protein [Vicinamibacterales bacterium]